MPVVYADTSALFAWFHPRDEFSRLVDRAVRKESPDFIYWTFLRFELRHNLRRCKDTNDGLTAWKALRAAEKTSARLRWESELTAERMLDSAEELSAETAGESECGSGDILHVAAARRVHLLSKLDGFWTCDTAQANLAKAVGLPVRLFQIKTPAR